MTLDRNSRPQQLATEDLDRAAGGTSIIDSFKLMSEMLSNLAKTRSDISMTFARNARA